MSCIEKYVVEEMNDPFEKIGLVNLFVLYTVPLSFGLYSMWAHSDICYLSSLVPASYPVGLKLSLIVASTIIHTWMYCTGWSSVIFGVIHNAVPGVAVLTFGAQTMYVLLYVVLLSS